MNSCYAEDYYGATQSQKLYNFEQYRVEMLDTFLVVAERVPLVLPASLLYNILYIWHDFFSK